MQKRISSWVRSRRPLNLPSEKLVDFARKKNVDRRTVYDWLAAGKIIGKKFGQCWYVYPSTLKDD